jgi:hypothetical protein
MMRTIEILLVIIILFGALSMASFYAVLPSPRQVSPLDLRKLASTTLQMLNLKNDLSSTVFRQSGDPAWGSFQVALSACLPPNIVYNLTTYEMTQENPYNRVNSISNTPNLGVTSEAVSYLIASSNVTFHAAHEVIGATLYILNCSDSNGWWITGYTAPRLAQDLYDLLLPYFQATIIVQNTTQLAQVLNGTSLQGETVQNAVVVNTFGEAVPIPAGYYSSSEVGYDATHSSYALYCYTLGQKVRLYNWTWVSIVGWPLYYVSNTLSFQGSQNGWGIYGMVYVGPSGLRSYLQGLDDQAYSYDNSNSQVNTTGISVSLSSNAQYYCNYYGIYPSPTQTATRRLSSSIITQYHLNVTSYVFDPSGNWIAGAVYRNNVSGGLLALGLTRTTDIRLTALGLLCDYKPRLYASEANATGTSRLVVLQLGQAGGT